MILWTIDEKLAAELDLETDHDDVPVDLQRAIRDGLLVRVDVAGIVSIDKYMHARRWEGSAKPGYYRIIRIEEDTTTDMEPRTNRDGDAP